MKTELYLKKIAVEAKAPSLEFLNELIAAHQKNISFNNLSVYYNPGQILNLDIGPLFEKVILNGEGGYCFENNKVFFYLLRNLGFTVEARAARVLYNQSGDIPRTHRTSIVTINEERYLVDVGFGKAVAPEAIAFNKKPTKSGHAVLMKDGRYYHQQFKDESHIDLYVFDDGEYQESDFIVANYYTNTHPNSSFTKKLTVARNENGMVEFINGKVYSKIENNQRIDIEIKSQEEFNFYLKKFGIRKIYDFNKAPLI